MLRVQRLPFKLGAYGSYIRPYCVPKSASRCLKLSTLRTNGYQRRTLCTASVDKRSDQNSDRDDDRKAVEAKKSGNGVLKLLGSLAVGVLVLGGGFIAFIRPPGGGEGIPLTKDRRRTMTDFQDTEIIYASKSTSEIYSDLLVYQLCNQEWLVNNAENILISLNKMGLGTLTNWLIKKTFYKHFCAGETLGETKEEVQKLRKEGVSVILDYCVEDSVDKEACEHNTRTLIELLQHIQSEKVDAKFVPLKITSLTNPKLLEHMTELLNYQNANPSFALPWNPDESLTKLDLKLSSATKGNTPLAQGRIPEPFTPQEIWEFRDLLKRIGKICKAASKANIALLVDAEQTHRQPAVDFLALFASKEYNKTKPIVYNTYQMYLTDGLSKLQKHVDLAQKENFYLGAKLVRGAYIKSETESAARKGVPSPIQSTKLLTDQSYHQGVSVILNSIRKKQKVATVIATHNMRTIYLVCQVIRENQLVAHDGNIQFAQLKGMSDHLTLGLALMHYNVSKLIPYGPVENVIPYMVRRLQENQDVMGGTQTERRLLWAELKRRNFM